LAGRLSQEVLEILLTDIANLRLSQEVLEALVGSNRPPKLSQEVVEVLIGFVSEGNALVSQTVVEVIQQLTEESLLAGLNSQLVVEVLREISRAEARISQICIELVIAFETETIDENLYGIQVI